jgi:hypothetical protein
MASAATPRARYRSIIHEAIAIVLPALQRREITTN